MHIYHSMRLNCLLWTSTYALSRAHSVSVDAQMMHYSKLSEAFTSAVAKYHADVKWRQQHSETRKLCYRKDDRAMRPIGPTWVPWKFSGLLTTPTAAIPNIFHGLVFGSTLWMFPQNLKFVALPVPDIIGGTQKIWAVPGYAHASFSPKLLMGLCSDRPCECSHKIWRP